MEDFFGGFSIGDSTSAGGLIFDLAEPSFLQASFSGSVSSFSLEAEDGSFNASASAGERNGFNSPYPDPSFGQVNGEEVSQPFGETISLSGALDPGRYTLEFQSSISTGIGGGGTLGTNGDLDLRLAITAVPEPSSAVIVALGLAKRRRKLLA